jgi:hypothetical protein
MQRSITCLSYAVTHGEEVWKRYLPEKSRPRYHFQLDLAQALAEAAIELDWPAGVRSDMNKPSWMRQKPCVPCACGTCFFCKKTMTTGVMTRPTSAAGVYAAKQHTSTTVSKNPCWVCIHVDNCKKNQAQATKATAAAVAGEFLVAFKGSRTCKLCDLDGRPLFCKTHWKEYDRKFRHKDHTDVAIANEAKGKAQRRRSAPASLGHISNNGASSA